MENAMLTITIPNAVWLDYLDPAASGMAAELGLPEPTFRKVGFGSQAVYEGITPEQADEIEGYLFDRARTLLGQDESGNVHRAALKASEKIRATLAA
jgi:hypothetical protein